MGKKPADRWTLPLCRSCHAEQHKVGEREFWASAAIDPFFVAEMLWATNENLPGMRALVFFSIAARNGGNL